MQEPTDIPTLITPRGLNKVVRFFTCACDCHAHVLGKLQHLPACEHPCWPDQDRIVGKAAGGGVEDRRVVEVDAGVGRHDSGDGIEGQGVAVDGGDLGPQGQGNSLGPVIEVGIVEPDQRAWRVHHRYTIPVSVQITIGAGGAPFVGLHRRLVGVGENWPHAAYARGTG